MTCHILDGYEIFASCRFDWEFNRRGPGQTSADYLDGIVLFSVGQSRLWKRLKDLPLVPSRLKDR